MGTIFGRPKWRQKFTQIIGLRCEDKKKIVLSSSSLLKEWGFRDLAKKVCMTCNKALPPFFFTSSLFLLRSYQKITAHFFGPGFATTHLLVVVIVAAV